MHLDQAAGPAFYAKYPRRAMVENDSNQALAPIPAGSPPPTASRPAKRRPMGAQSKSIVPPPPAGDRAFLSRGEVARLFGVSVSTVTRWARTGLLKAVRTPGGHYRFRADEMRRAARAGSPDELIRLD